MRPENYKRDLAAFRDGVLGFLKNESSPADAKAASPGIMICVDRAVPGLMAEYRKTIPREAFMLYLHPPCGASGEASLKSSIPPGEKTLVSALGREACSSDKAGVLVSLLPGRKVSVSVSAELEKLFIADISDIRKAVENAISNAAQSSAARIIYLRNSIKNLPFILRDCGKKVKITPENIPAVVCSAGPSLSKSIPALKQYAQGMIVIASGRVVPVLVEAGIIPDFIVDVDPDISWVKHRMKIESVSIAAASVFPNPDFEDSATLWSYGDSPAFNRIMKDMGLELNSFTLSKTVTVTALDFAVSSGIKNISMIGSDLCMSGSGDYHVKQEAGKTYKKEILFETDGNDGGKVFCDPSLNSLRKAIEDYVFHIKEKYGDEIRIFNCTEGGARIARLEKTAFENFCSEFALAGKKIEITETPQLKKDIAITAMRESLAKYISVTGDMLETSRKLEREIRNSNAAPDKIMGLQENLRKLGEEELCIRMSKPFSIIAAPVHEQADDFIGEMPFPEKASPEDVSAQIRDFRKRYTLIHDLLADIKNDFDEAANKIGGAHGGRYYRRDFSSFRNYAVAFIRKRNRELAEFLSGCKEPEIDGKYLIVPNLQYLPSVALPRGGGRIYLNDSIMMENAAAGNIENFVRATDFSPDKNLAVFFAPGNWMHAAAMAEKFPGAEIIIVEIWLDLFYHIIGQSMFFHRFSDKALVVGIHEKLRNSSKLLMSAIGESGKKPLFFEDPATWRLEEVRDAFKKIFNGL